MSLALSSFQDIQCREKTLSLNSRVFIMGVLNVTPDSFSDGGRFVNARMAIDQAHQLIEEGADILDIGGESTRPGAEYVTSDDEIDRIKPVFEAIGHSTTIPLSVDTRKAVVARMALDLGADLVNDVSALQDDPTMASLVEETSAGVVLMHRQGASATMQQNPHYTDVIQDVKGFLAKRIAFARSQGISASQIIVDPGIGFGKSLHHNLRILANISEFVELGHPVLIGVSRKAMIGELTGKSVSEREMGNAAVMATAVWQGVHILRVHDVRAMKDVISVAQALRKSCDK